MDLKVDSDTVFVFDLDDTLYYEYDYLVSAYKEIANKIGGDNIEEVLDQMLTKYASGENVFNWLVSHTNSTRPTSVIELLGWYRLHQPTITLRDGALKLIHKIKMNNGKIGLLTDGRSISQRNKITSLGIEKYLNKIVISEEIGTEKPNVLNFLAFEEMGKDFVYLADNLAKDFIAPNQLGWTTICINGNERKIYKNEGNFNKAQLPKHFIEHFDQINII